LAAYPAIQFNLRHFFHLEFIWILCFFSLLTLPHQLYHNFLPLVRFSLCCLILFSIGYVIYFATLFFQKERLSSALVNILSSPREVVTVKEKKAGGQKISLSVPIPDEQISIINGKYDSMTPEIGAKGIEWDVRAGASRYLLSVTGTGCNTHDIPISIIYKHTPSTWQPLDKIFNLAKNPKEASNALLFSGFYRPSQYFNEIQIPLEFSNCKFKLEKIIDDGTLPNTFVATISDNRLIGPYYKGLGKLSK
jgi:hypothetical protein